MANKIRIAIADDHPVVAEGISLILEASGSCELVAKATDGEGLLKLLETTEIDLVLLDIEMPGMGGLKTARVMSEKHPSIGIIALSMQQEPSLVKAMFSAGAKAYLLKNADKSEILKAITEVHQGQRYLGPGITEILIGSDTKSEKDNQTFAPLKLSRREKEVLALIVSEHTTAEIAEKLSLSKDTIETHRRRMLAKLNVRNTAGLVRVCMEYNVLGN